MVLFVSRNFIAVFFSGLLSFALTQTHAARASSFNVNPIRVFLSDKIPSALLSVRNDSGEKLRFELGVFAWDQSPQGEMILNATEDIVFFPVLLTLAPGEERKVRIGTVARFESREKTYRIFVDELPDLGKAENNQVRILTRMGVPIFLQPSRQVKEGQIEAMTIDRGRFAFQLANKGNVHFVARRIVVKGTGSEGEIFLQRELEGWYILAGGSRSYTLDLPRKDCMRLQRLAVEVEADERVLRDSLAVKPGSCGE